MLSFRLGRYSTGRHAAGQDPAVHFRVSSFARFLLLLSLWLGAILPAASGSQAHSTAVDALHYRISLEIPSKGEEIQAKTEILIAFQSDGVQQVDLDLTGLAVDEATEDGHPARFSRAEEHLAITLQGQYRAGDRCQLAIKYHGQPADGLSIKTNKFGDRSIFADNWPNRARYWFPSFDTPDDKATAEFLVTAPDRYDVIANGKLVETTSLQNGRRLTHWSETVPIPTYCMVVGVTEFSILHAGVAEGISLDYYLYPKDRDRGVKDYGRALQMLEFYSNLIGPYPYEKLALVESSTRFGGMENSSSIFFDERAYNGSGHLESTVAHEIAHQWFGDSVTEAEWHHLWLSEGFATYFGRLFFERADGRDKFVQLMLADKQSYLEEYSADPRPIYDQSISDLFKLLNANNYQKGGWVLHMLRHIMGDERFFAGIRDYYRTYRDRNALTSDFEKVMEFHAGRSLDWFFHQWIYEPGYPVYDATWQWDESGKAVRLHVVQKQPQTVFRMPLDVEISVAGKNRRESIEVNDRDQWFSFKADSKPQHVALDPDEWVLKVLTLAER